MVERQEAWKFSTLGLLAILAISLSIPQAAAHITNNTQHMLTHIYNFVDGIEAKTDNLPSDPASNTVVNTRSSQASVDDLQSDVDAIRSQTDIIPTDPADQSLIDTQLASIQSDTDDIQTELGSLSGGGSSPKFVEVNVSLDPATGSVADRINLIPFTGKMYSGIISGTFFQGSGIVGSSNVVQLKCSVGGSLSNVDILVDFSETFHGLSTSGSFSKVFTCPVLEFFVFDINDGNEAGAATLRANVQYVESTEITELTN